MYEPPMDENTLLWIWRRMGSERRAKVWSKLQICWRDEIAVRIDEQKAKGKNKIPPSPAKRGRLAKGLN